LFSLTPVFLLGVAGIAFCLSPTGRSHALKILGGLTLFVTLVVIGFYIVKTNNYGGWTSGPRWLMWLTPFFLLSMVPAADWLAPRRWGRALAYAFLAISVLSVSYPAWNPWRHPWLYNLMENWGWIGY
jgi:Zn-dependent protease with chaperone function